jgi:hypothetical protein
MDLTLEGSIGGDPAQSLSIDPGSCTVGKVKARVTGDVTFAREGIRIEVDRPTAKNARPQPPFVLDTREWMVAQDSSPSSSATPGLPPAPAPSGKHH